MNILLAQASVIFHHGLPPVERILGIEHAQKVVALELLGCIKSAVTSNVALKTDKTKGRFSSLVVPFFLGWNSNKITILGIIGFPSVGT